MLVPILMLSPALGRPRLVFLKHVLVIDISRAICVEPSLRQERIVVWVMPSGA